MRRGAWRSVVLLAAPAFAAAVFAAPAHADDPSVPAALISDAATEMVPDAAATSLSAEIAAELHAAAVNDAVAPVEAESPGNQDRLQAGSTEEHVISTHRGGVHQNNAQAAWQAVSRAGAATRPARYQVAARQYQPVSHEASRAPERTARPRANRPRESAPRIPRIARISGDICAAQSQSCPGMCDSDEVANPPENGLQITPCIDDGARYQCADPRYQDPACDEDAADDADTESSADTAHPVAAPQPAAQLPGTSTTSGQPASEPTPGALLPTVPDTGIPPLSAEPGSDGPPVTPATSVDFGWQLVRLWQDITTPAARNVAAALPVVREHEQVLAAVTVQRHAVAVQRRAVARQVVRPVAPALRRPTHHGPGRASLVVPLQATASAHSSDDWLIRSLVVLLGLAGLLLASAVVSGSRGAARELGGLSSRLRSKGLSATRITLRDRRDASTRDEGDGIRYRE